MPPLAIHTAIAKEVADRLQLALLDSQRGDLYLGATAPDIRVMTRWERERTHFFDLRCFDEQSGVSGFFSAYPALADPAALNAATASFVAGYLSHLVTDETWISTIYRPFFGERSALGGTLRANVMDRALQFSLDAERRGDSDLMVHVVEAVARSALDLQIDFIDRETLRSWHRLIIDFVNQQPDWDRFRDRAARHLKEAGFEGADDVEEMTRSLPDLVDETLRYLRPEIVRECLQDSTQRCVGAIKEYLACA
ncbi:MAG: zinc dependent phospholipase C family protein [Dehalococcoidia bacterium]|nr:zinc dependent phospholipase C family protein [Dehalococcoidia bacterium]